MMGKHSSDRSKAKSTASCSDDDDSCRGRVSSIDRLISNFFEIVGIDDFSQEFSDRGNLQISRHSNVSGTGSSSCDDSESAEGKIFVQALDNMEQRRNSRIFKRFEQSQRRPSEIEYQRGERKGPLRLSQHRKNQCNSLALTLPTITPTVSLSAAKDGTTRKFKFPKLLKLRSKSEGTAR
jgi:hypothetical protein